MKFLQRRPKPPAEAVARLDRDERVVSFADTPTGTALATPLGLWLPGYEERLPWHLIDKATWKDGTLTLVPALDTGDGVLDELAPRAARLTVPRDLPKTVQVRVLKAIAFTRHHPLPGDGVRRGVRVVGRRVPGRDGVTWQLVFDDGVDRTDPAVRAAAAAYTEQARAELGL